MGLRNIGNTLGTIGRFGGNVLLNMLDPSRAEMQKRAELMKLQAVIDATQRAEQRSFLTQQAERDLAARMQMTPYQEQSLGLQKEALRQRGALAEDEMLMNVVGKMAPRAADVPDRWQVYQNFMGQGFDPNEAMINTRNIYSGMGQGQESQRADTYPLQLLKEYNDLAALKYGGTKTIDQGFGLPPVQQQMDPSPDPTIDLRMKWIENELAKYAPTGFSTPQPVQPSQAMDAKKNAAMRKAAGLP